MHATPLASHETPRAEASDAAAAKRTTMEFIIGKKK
jgi:hypothetical protein